MPFNSMTPSLHENNNAIITRLVATCTAKCVAPNYGDGELTKGESVCLDRCFTKYLEVSDPSFFINLYEELNHATKSKILLNAVCHSRTHLDDLQQLIHLLTHGAQVQELIGKKMNEQQNIAPTDDKK